MDKLNFREIRTRFLEYFKARGHEIVESSSLIPQDDPTLLFTNAGMVQFKSLFLGEGDKKYPRAASSQKCMRAGGKHNDLENVGYTARHHTFFEMLGNFSFGDYFKEEAIIWAWELLTEIYHLPKDKLYASVYKDDDEAFRIWEEKIGLPTTRIVRLGERDNFWSMGDTGPCGPCSEIHIDQGPSVGCGKPDCAPGCDCDRYLEIWNLVFTQFNREKDGGLTSLPRPNIDTGMGLERLAAVIQGVTSNYDTDVFRDIIGRVEEISGKKYGEGEREKTAFRVISDHARSSAFLIGDGIMPSNEGRGYVLRRIIRRAIRFGQVFGLKDRFLASVCSRVVDVMGPDYEELRRSKHLIEGVVGNEEKRFADTLHYGMGLLDEEIQKLRESNSDIIPGEVAFRLYDTYGLSVDIVQDVAREEKLKVDLAGYERAMSRQKAMSQESWKGSGEKEMPEAYRDLLNKSIASDFRGYDSLALKAVVVAVLVDGKQNAVVNKGQEAEIVLDQTPFYGQAGGQAGDTGWLVNDETRFWVTATVKLDNRLIIHKGKLESGVIKRNDKVEAIVDKDKRSVIAVNHTATHLLHAVLRDLLGEHVNQAGSLVASDRFRFDFSHFTQVKWEKLMEIEQMVNRLIRRNLPVVTTEMSKDEAMKTGAMAIFEERYGATVRLVTIGDGVSMELCGGTHTNRTGDIGLFKIISEGAVAANIRRIEALTGQEAVRYTQARESEIRHAAALLKTTPDKLGDSLERLLRSQKEKESELESLKAKLLFRASDDLMAGVKEIGNIKVLARELSVNSARDLRESADRMKDKLGSCVVFLAAENEGKVMLVCVVSKDLTGQIKAGEIIKRASELVDGKGGGRPDMAQGGGSNLDGVKAAIAAVSDFIKAAT
jgi:alanyl-tRNA synthetase